MESYNDQQMSVQYEDEDEDDGSKLAENDFFFTTPDISALGNLFYAMTDIVKQMCIRVSKEGVRVSERVSCDNLFILVNLPAANFEKFECEGDSIICFEPQMLYQCLRDAGAKDVAYFKFDKRKNFRLLVGIWRNGNSHSLTEYRVPLLRCTDRVYSSPAQEMELYAGL
jgi:hypothetical protein